MSLFAFLVYKRFQTHCNFNNLKNVSAIYFISSSTKMFLNILWVKMERDFFFQISSNFLPKVGCICAPHYLG